MWSTSDCEWNKWKQNRFSAILFCPGALLSPALTNCFLFNSSRRTWHDDHQGWGLQRDDFYQTRIFAMRRIIMVKKRTWENTAIPRHGSVKKFIKKDDSVPNVVRSNYKRRNVADSRNFPGKSHRKTTNLPEFTKKCAKIQQNKTIHNDQCALAAAYDSVRR